MIENFRIYIPGGLSNCLIKMLVWCPRAPLAELFFLWFIVMVTVRVYHIVVTVVIVVTVCVDSCDVQGMMKVVIVMMMSVRFVKQTMPPAAT